MSRWHCRFSRHDFLKRVSIAHREMNMYQHDGCWWCCYLCCWVLDPGKSAAIDSRLNRRMFQVGGFSSTKRWWQLPRSASTKLLLFILPIFHSDSLLFFFFFLLNLIRIFFPLVNFGFLLFSPSDLCQDISVPHRSEFSCYIDRIFFNVHTPSQVYSAWHKLQELNWISIRINIWDSILKRGN